MSFREFHRCLITPPSNSNALSPHPSHLRAVARQIVGRLRVALGLLEAGELLSTATTQEMEGHVLGVSTHDSHHTAIGGSWPGPK